MVTDEQTDGRTNEVTSANKGCQTMQKIKINVETDTPVEGCRSEHYFGCLADILVCEDDRKRISQNELKSFKCIRCKH